MVTKLHSVSGVAVGSIPVHALRAFSFIHSYSPGINCTRAPAYPRQLSESVGNSA